MAEPTSIPANEETRRVIEDEATKRGIPVATYLAERILGRGGRARRGMDGEPDGKAAGLRNYVDSMKDFAEMAPTLLMLKAMGMGTGGMMGGADGITKRDLEDLLSRRHRRDEDDEDEDPLGRKMEKMAMRRMSYRLYAQMLGGDSEEGKQAQRIADKYDLEIRELRKAYEETKEATTEKLEVEKAERHKSEMEARDRELQALRDQFVTLQEQLNNREAPPQPWEQMREMAASLIAAKEAWSGVEKSFQSPPPAPGKDSPTVEKLGHVLDRGASAAKDFLTGLGALQAGQRGIPPGEVGHVPPPPMPPPMPNAPPVAAPVAPQPEPQAAPAPSPAPPPRSAGPPLVAGPQVASPEEVYYDGEGNPISQGQFESATRDEERES